MRRLPDSLPDPDVAVVGGSGLYALFDDPVEVEVETPYGAPSGPVTVGLVGEGGRERSVAFLPRHGPGHRYPAHRIPVRANLWALRSLGVRQVLAPCAVGSLRAELGPGTLVVPDQLLDRTTRRDRTYYDEGTVHVGFADPYCPRLRTSLLSAAGDAVDGATLVVVDGPRFSTRAESRAFAAAGGSVIGMTSLPEAALARELALCYAGVALVTDLDAGVEAGEGVSHLEVLEVFARHTARLKDLLGQVAAGLPVERDCPCPHALDGLTLPLTLP